MIKKSMKWLASEESGQGMVEYGLIIALVSVAAIVALGLVGNQLRDMFNSLTNKITIAE